MFLHREALAAKVRALAGADVTAQRDGLRGISLASARGLSKRDAVPADVEAGLKAKLGGDIIGRIVPFVISTPERASDGHTLDPQGVDFEEYDRAPHVFWQHEYSGWRASPSRGASRIGASVIQKGATEVSAMCGFFSRDFSMCLDEGFSYAIGEIAALQGHRASVGFDIVEASVASEEVRKTVPWALDVSAWRLGEWSLVNFSADTDAISAGRGAGIDTAPIARALERFLDDVAGMSGLARVDLERAWLAAADPSRPRVITSPAPSLSGADLQAAMSAALAHVK